MTLFTSTFSVPWLEHGTPCLLTPSQAKDSESNHREIFTVLTDKCGMTITYWHFDIHTEVT